MLKSLFSGVSGLRNHQMKMDVLGNNIANVNTVGYKGSRINFSEALNQTIANAMPGRGTGSVNPMQVGLGMKTSAIENMFTQGGLETTGVITDLAIEGEGFFVLRSGENQLYSRAGQFYFNEDGQLVNNKGLAIQGWMLNEGNKNSELGAGNLNDIVIDKNQVSQAQATQNVYLNGNLNAGLETVAEIWELSESLTSGGSNATAATDLNSLDQTTTPLVAGDTIDISGTNPDGSTVTATYTYTAGDTVQNLLDAINSAYTGATASVSDGKIVMTDDAAGESSTTIALSNGTGNTGSIDLANFVNTTKGVTGKATTSVVVYDSLGASHNLVMEFTKTANNNEWQWEVVASGGETITAGGTGTITFDSAGNLSSFVYDGGVNTLEIDPGNGANSMSIQLDVDGNEKHSGLSQFESLSTLDVREQDGRATGELLGININRDGTITGSFSNGEIEELAKLALGRFANNGGLSDLGNGLYQKSIASGEEDIVNLQKGGSTSIVSGALEMSNVDLSSEFTEMITTQRGFQASAKVITTADQLLDELIRLKR